MEKHEKIAYPPKKKGENMEKPTKPIEPVKWWEWEEPSVEVFTEKNIYAPKPVKPKKTRPPKPRKTRSQWKPRGRPRKPKEEHTIVLNDLLEPIAKRYRDTLELKIDYYTAYRSKLPPYRLTDILRDYVNLLSCTCIIQTVISCGITADEAERNVQCRKEELDRLKEAKLKETASISKELEQRASLLRSEIIIYTLIGKCLKKVS